MENIYWRNGLGAATSAERMVILDCEHRARCEAIQCWYSELLAETDSLVVDSHHLDVRGASTLWGRKGGYLYLRIVVYGRSAGRIRTFCWRRPVRPSAPNGHLKSALRLIDKR